MCIDENLPDLSGIPDFLFVMFLFFSGYGHHHISGSLNFRAILIYGVLCLTFRHYHSGSDPRSDEFDQAAMAVRTTQMIEMLSEENRALREELSVYYKKVSKLQKVFVFAIVTRLLVCFHC